MLKAFKIQNQVHTLHLPMINITACMSAQSCPTLGDPGVCSLPGSSVLVIFQARILEWVAISYSRKTVQKKKSLNDSDNHDGVVTNLEPDILDSEVKWALGGFTTNKARGDDGIPAELFKILQDDAVISVALKLAANLENSAVDIGVETVSFHFNSKEGQCQRMFKLPHNCTHFTC